MLVTNPPARASLAEVLEHPWMLRGFNGPPDSHMVHREPLRADELDRHVIRGMKGFEFGTEDEIERNLRKVLESDSYIRAVQAWDRKRSGRNGASHRFEFSNSSLAISYDGSASNAHKNESTMSPSKKSKRFSGFDFYRRKLFSPSSSPPTTPSHSPPTSQSLLSIGDGTREPVDPTQGFHPLISMYYLSREKLERERVYGPGRFASSQLSLQSVTPANAPAVETSAPPPYPSTKHLSQPTPVKKDQQQLSAPIPASAKADYSMPLPRLPAPETSHYSDMSYDATAAASPTSAAFHGQVRARDAGLPAPPAAKRLDIPQPSTHPMPGPQTALPRAPPASTHRRSHSMSQRPTALRGSGGMFSGGEERVDEHGEEQASHTARLDAEFSEQEQGRGPSEENRMPSHAHEGGPLSAGATLVRKFGTLLVGKGDDTKRSVGKRMTVVDSVPLRPGDEGEKGAEVSGKRGADADVRKSIIGSPPIAASQSQPLGNIHRRAATILDPQGRQIRHERRSSTGGALLPSIGGTIGRHRRPSTGYGTSSGRPTGLGGFGRTEKVDENVEQEAADQDDGFKDGQSGHHNDKEFKPVHLKGLFR